MLVEASFAVVGMSDKLEALAFVCRAVHIGIAFLGQEIVLAAESEVHKAMATAMKNGKFGVMDYYKLQNMVADTNMRNSISNKDIKPGKPEER